MTDVVASAMLSPAIVLSLLVGAFHTCLYLVIRGRIGIHIVFVLLAAVLGAFVGQAIGGRVGDPLHVGAYGLLWASAISWLGIGLVVLVSLAAGLSRRSPPPGGHE